VRHTQPGVVALLLRRLDGGLAGAQAAALGDEGRGRRVKRCGVGGHGMLRRECHEGHAEQRVRPGREHLDLALIASRRCQGKAHPCALAAADPAGLHGADPFGPAIQAVQRGQQLRRELGDAQEPLAELPLLDRGAGPPAASVNHLLVGQHGAVHRVPVDPAQLALRQACRHQAQEQALLLAVVLGIAGCELT